MFNMLKCNYLFEKKLATIMRDRHFHVLRPFLLSLAMVRATSVGTAGTTVNSTRPMQNKRLNYYNYFLI